ncbi:MAG: S49 family peptidase [Pseudomonadales bacterium]|nr:S49 family peptidase [Pseudomonadales bacterium]
MFGFGKKKALPVNEQDRAWYMLEKLVNESQIEQRRTRRWGVFFKLLTFVYLIGAMLLFSPALQQGDGKAVFSAAKEHTAVVRVHGVIAEDQEASANVIVTGLRGAFENAKTKAVLLVINSPGGSPVQSNYVYDEIKRLRTKYPAIPLYAVIGDIGASGAYYIASAADKIYASESSLVGSIGVTAAGFGFVEAMNKLGVERRNYTSGEHKSFLDPFSPAKPEESAFWQQVLDKTHQQFIKRVRDGRGNRLKETPEMFSGLIWNGEQALALGLIDGYGSPGQVARDVVKAEDIVDYTSKKNPFDVLAGKLGASAGAAFAEKLGLTAEPQFR